MFDEYFNPPPIAISPVQEAAAPRAEVLVDSPVSTSIDQDAPSTSIPSSQEHEQSPIISQDGNKDHPIANVIGDTSRSVSTRKQLETDAMWCYFDAFLYFNNVFLIKLKWIYKVKTDESGGVLKNKARLVAQGFRQEEGIDFEESFASVARIEPYVSSSKRLFMVFKQAPRAWYDMLSSFLISQQFSKGAVDPTLFTRHAGNDILLDTDMSLTAYADADHAGCQDTRRSTSGSAQFLGDFTDFYQFSLRVSYIEKMAFSGLTPAFRSLKPRALLSLEHKSVDPHGFEDSHKDGLGVKELLERMLIKAFMLSNQERYEHVGPKVTSSQDGKVYKMAKRDYAWLMISRCSRSHIHIQVKINKNMPSIKSMYHYAMKQDKRITLTQKDIKIQDKKLPNDNVQVTRRDSL
ncbi:retrovirus-related pol polyprotein from transposon TNT 1-94 [Tanacetum coccineum]